MKLLASLGFAAALVLSTAALAGPEGTWNVNGTNPDGDGTYDGSVKVARTGDGIYKVSWKIGGDTFVGTAIGNDDFISVGYRSGGNYGVALYVRDGKIWEGVWAYDGGTDTGTETWSK